MHKVIAFVMCSLAAPALAQFEGEIEMKLKSEHMQGKSKLFLGKPGMRMEMHMEVAQAGPVDMVTLMRFKEPTLVYQLNEADKTYSVLDTKKMGTSENRQSKYTVKKVGEDKIAGYKCVHTKVTDEEKNEFDVWTTKEIGGDAWSKMMGQRGAMRNAEGMMAALKKENADGFMAKLESKDMTMELVKAEKKAVEASKFEVPAGYTESKTAGLPPAAKKMMENLTPEQLEMLKKAQGGH